MIAPPERLKLLENSGGAKKSRALTNKNLLTGGLEMKVLIIEDSEDFLKSAKRLITRVLKYELIETGTTKTVEQAIDLIRTHADADIILLDMNYNGYHNDDKADGCKVASQLTEEECERIICMSGTPKCYEKYLRPLGVRHFGGKTGFDACLAGTCKCE